MIQSRWAQFPNLSTVWQHAAVFVERSSQSPDTCNLCSSWSVYAAWLHWECVCMCGSICVLVWERVCVWMGACVFFPARLDHQWFAVLHCTESPTQGEGVKGRALHVLTHIPSFIHTRTHTWIPPGPADISLLVFKWKTSTKLNQFEEL